MFFLFNVSAHNGNNESAWTEYIASYSYEQAVIYLQKRLSDAGWIIDKLEGIRISITDIRDICDQTTW